jgi:hypothetical protein
MGASGTVEIFWFGELDLPPKEVELLDWCARSLAFGAFSLMKKSLVLRNSKSLLRATGRGETFSTIRGSTRWRAAWLEAAMVTELRARKAMTSLIWLIKPNSEASVNEQPLLDLRCLLELIQMST